MYIILALVAIDPDISHLCELEDESGSYEVVAFLDNQSLLSFSLFLNRSFHSIKP